jgi:tRNA (guanine37-N1)-methyltransferase
MPPRDRPCTGFYFRLPVYPVQMKLGEVLAGTIPEDKLSRLSNHFDVVGDIAILTIPPELSEYKQAIASAIVTNRRNIYTVLNKVTKVSGEDRTASYEILAGDTTIALHREFGFEYRFDVTKVFFNVHLAYERIRVADQVEPGEEVLVPFAGVGPFAIPAAAKGAQVVAIENNPDAFAWLNENIALNKVRDHLVPIEADAFDTSRLPRDRFDRIIIPTPYGEDRIFGILAPFVAPGGMIHFYTFKTRQQIPLLIEEYGREGFAITYYRSCGNVAPGVSRWVFDLERE